MGYRDSLIAGLPAIVLVAPLYAADYLTAEQAQKVLFPQATQFVDRAVNLTDEQRDRIRALSGMRQRWERQAIWHAEKGGQPLGWFMVDEVVGKHEFITYGVALSLDGKVLGLEILSYRETHGSQIRNADWRAEFRRQVVGFSVQTRRGHPEYQRCDAVVSQCHRRCKTLAGTAASGADRWLSSGECGCCSERSLKLG